MMNIWADGEPLSSGRLQRAGWVFLRQARRAPQAVLPRVLRAGLHSDEAESVRRAMQPLTVGTGKKSASNAA
jgi:hypothetical protein